MIYLLIGIIGFLLGMHFIIVKNQIMLEEKLIYTNKKLNELSKKLPDKTDENQLDKAAQ